MATQSYLDQLKATSSADAYNKLLAAMQYSANEAYGGTPQDWQAQIFTNLKTDAPKSVDLMQGQQALASQGYQYVANGTDSDGNQIVELQKSLGTVNGLPITASYDPQSGKLIGYQAAQNYRNFSNGSHSVGGSWDAEGKPTPTQYSSGGGGFLSSVLGDIGGGISDLLSSDLGKLALVAGGAYAGGAFDPTSVLADTSAGASIGAANDLAAAADYANAYGSGAGSLAPAAAGAGAAYEAGAGGTNLFADGAIPGNAADLAGYGAVGAGTAAAAAGAAGTAGAAEAAGAAGAAGAGAAGAGLTGALGGYAVPAAILGSSLLGANAASDAASTQAAATDRANQLIYNMYQEQKGLQEPYRAAGVTAQNRLLDLLGLSGNTSAADYGAANKNFTPSDLTSDPSYQFRLTEGLKALDRQAAARGGLISGGALKAAQTYGQDQASQEYQNAFNRYQTNRTNMLQPLGNLVTSGQNAAANLGSAAANYGTTAGNNITSGAAANAAGTVGSANALAGGLGQYLGYTSSQDLTNAIRQSAYTRNP